MFRSVQYDCIRKLRREKRYISDEMLKLESLSEAELADGAMYEEMFPEEEYSDEAYIQLMHEVEQLPEQARRIFIAVVIEDRKYKEVASSSATLALNSGVYFLRVVFPITGRKVKSKI